MPDVLDRSTIDRSQNQLFDQNQTMPVVTRSYRKKGITTLTENRSTINLDSASNEDNSTCEVKTTSPTEENPQSLWLVDYFLNFRLRFRFQPCTLQVIAS